MQAQRVDAKIGTGYTETKTKENLSKESRSIERLSVDQSPLANPEIDS